MRFLDVIQIFSFVLTGTGFFFAIVDVFFNDSNGKMEKWTQRLENQGRTIKNRFGCLFFLLLLTILIIVPFSKYLFHDFDKSWIYAFLIVGNISFALGLNLYFYLKENFLPERPYMALCLTMNTLGFAGEFIQVIFINY